MKRTGMWLLPFLLVPSAAAGQRVIEPRAFVTAGFGFGALRPSGDTGLDGEVADGDVGLQITVGIESRQSRWITAYLRGDADVSDIRQHIGLVAGARFDPVRTSRLRPYGAVGGGLMWLEPKVQTLATVERDITLRGEGIAGVDWAAIPGLRVFAEYRLTGSNYFALAVRPDCDDRPERCLETSDRAVLHLGHGVWTGVRIKLY